MNKSVIRAKKVGIVVLSKKPFVYVPFSFYKFFLTGVLAFIADTIVLNIAIHFLFNGDDKRLFEAVSVAKIFASITGIIVGFIINRNWSFKENKSQNAKKQGAKYSVVFFINLGLASIIFPIYLDFISQISFLGGLQETVANMFTAGTIMFASYFLYKFFVFK